MLQGVESAQTVLPRPHVAPGFSLSWGCGGSPRPPTRPRTSTTPGSTRPATRAFRGPAASSTPATSPPGRPAARTASEEVRFGRLLLRLQKYASRGYKWVSTTCRIARPLKPRLGISFNVCTAHRLQTRDCLRSCDRQVLYLPSGTPHGNCVTSAFAVGVAFADAGIGQDARALATSLAVKQGTARGPPPGTAYSSPNRVW